MDSENRARMYQLLAAGQVQRNVGKVIGCKTTLFKFEDEASPNEDDKEEDEEEEPELLGCMDKNLRVGWDHELGMG